MELGVKCWPFYNHQYKHQIWPCKCLTPGVKVEKRQVFIENIQRLFYLLYVLFKDIFAMPYPKVYKNKMPGMLDPFLQHVNCQSVMSHSQLKGH